jgi:hypothetical protein
MIHEGDPGRYTVWGIRDGAKKSYREVQDQRGSQINKGRI